MHIERARRRFPGAQLCAAGVLLCALGLVQGARGSEIPPQGVPSVGAALVVLAPYLLTVGTSAVSAFVWIVVRSVQLGRQVQGLLTRLETLEAQGTVAASLAERVSRLERIVIAPDDGGMSLVAKTGEMVARVAALERSAPSAEARAYGEMLAQGRELLQRMEALSRQTP